MVGDAATLDALKRPPNQRHGEVGKTFGQGRWHLGKTSHKVPDPSTQTAGAQTVLVAQDRFHPKVKSPQGKELHIDRQTGRPMWPLSAREIQPYTTEHQVNFVPRKGHAQTTMFNRYQKQGIKG